MTSTQKTTQPNWPRITVVTPSYNQGRFLEATIRSVLEQNYPNLEYFILDGGSTDESKGIIERYADRLDFWCSERDGGQTEALIRGFNKGTGDIYCWLNSDDVFHPNCLWRVGRYFLDHPQTEVIFGATTFIDELGAATRQYRPAPFSRWLALHCSWVDVPQPSTFFRAGLYHRTGGLDPAYAQVYMDSELWLRFSEVTELVYVPEFWSMMRQYPQIKSIRLMSLYRQLHRRNAERILGPDTAWRRHSKRAAAWVLRSALRSWRDRTLPPIPWWKPAKGIGVPLQRKA